MAPIRTRDVVDTGTLLHHRIEAQAARTPGACALRLDDATLSYATLADRARRIAAGARALGIASGDRIAYLGKNDPRLFEWMMAASVGGFVLVPLNWRLSPGELQAILVQSEARLLIVAHAFASVLDTLAVPPAEIMALDAGHAGLRHFDGWRDGLEGAPIEPATYDEAVVLQLYTSGTTGLPKGVMLTHRNVLGLRDPALGQPPWERAGADAVALVAMPLFHIGGIAASFSILCTGSGGAVVLMRDFDVSRIAELLAADRLTRLCLVPAMVRAILDHAPAAALRSKRLRYVMYGASPMTAALLKAAMEGFDADFVQLYGLTEVSGYVTTLSPEDHRSDDPAIVTSIGRPVPGVDIRIVDPHGDDVPRGDSGEIWTRSVATMAGYFRQPERTAEVLDEDGWFRTGDAGFFLPSGHIVLRDRIKNMIISGGENIYPAEIENLLAACPGIADVAVIGVPDERWGEVPRAFVVPSDPALRAHHILAWADGRIARFKMPKSFAFVESLPRNPSGKILHRALRDAPSGASL